MTYTSRAVVSVHKIYRHFQEFILFYRLSKRCSDQKRAAFVPQENLFLYLSHIPVYYSSSSLNTWRSQVHTHFNIMSSHGTEDRATYYFVFPSNHSIIMFHMVTIFRYLPHNGLEFEAPRRWLHCHCIGICWMVRSNINQLARKQSHGRINFEEPQLLRVFHSQPSGHHKPLRCKLRV